MSPVSIPLAPPPDAKGDGPPRWPAWQCIGCGRIEGPRPCIGVCRDRRVELVEAGELDAVSAQLAASQQRLAAVEALLRRLTVTTPHEGECLRSWRALQEEARRLLARTSR